MSEPSSPRVLLIDLDNCPRQLERLHETLSGFARVIACHGGVEPKVALGLVPLLATAIHEKKLEIVSMKRGGKNAADFAMSFWAGRLSAEMPPETHFEILSHDTDLDRVVELLTSLGRRVSRIDGKRLAAPGLHSVSPIKGGVEVEDVREFQVKHLLPKHSRPAKRATLLSSLRTFCKGRPGADPQAMLVELTDLGIVTIDGQGRVAYPEPGQQEEIPF